MADEARRIVENNGVDLESLILMWNKALADEWFAFIQFFKKRKECHIVLCEKRKP